MELSVRMKNMVEKKLASCEEVYGVKVLFWSFRGSLNIDISRKNSDLDVIFVFKNRMENKIAAIHDIIGYGFDFWGWDIEDAVRTIEINNQSYYQNRIAYKNIPLTHEHARGGLTYYSGIYCYFGSAKSGSNIEGISALEHRLLSVMEKPVLMFHILVDVGEQLDKLEIEGGMSACDYLYAVWGVLQAEHVYRGGLPGESEIDPLMEQYMDQDTKHITNRLRSIYKNSLSKHAQFFQIEELNVFIRNRYFLLKKVSEELTPQYKADAQNRIDELKSYIKELKV